MGESSLQADSKQPITSNSQWRVEQDAQGLKKIQCPICLRAVPPTRDAFLEPCFHAFCGEVLLFLAVADCSQHQ